MEGRKINQQVKKNIKIVIVNSDHIVMPKL